MGSVERYDFKQRKWVPYRSTPEDVEQYFKKMDALREEKEHGPGYKMKKLRDMEEKLEKAEMQLAETKAELKRKAPQVTQITPVAQAIKIAKSQVNQAGRETKRPKSRYYWNNY